MTTLPSQQARAGVFYGWYVVAGSLLGAMVGFASIFIFTFGVFLKPLAEHFGRGRTDVALGFSIAAVTCAFCSPVIGRIADRVGARGVLAVCTTVLGISFAALSRTAEALWSYYLTCFVMGIVANGTTHLVYSRIISLWFDRRRGLALALVMSGVGLGAMIMPVLAQSLISSFGWRTACIAFGAMTLAVSLPITAFVLRDSPQEMNLHPDGGAEARPAAHAAEFSVGQAFRSRIFWSLAGGFFLLSLGANGVLAHLPALASDRGIAARDAALTTSVLGGASLLGRLVTGVLLDRFFGPHIAVVVLLGAIAGMAVLATSYSLAGVLIAAALMGLAIGAEADLMPYLISRYMGLRSMGEIYGYIFTAYAVAGALGPLVMGWGYDTLGNYTRIVWVFAGATGMSAILLGLLPRYPQRST